MAGDNLSEVVYEEVFLSAKKLGVSQSVSDDMARMVDDGIKRRCGGDRVYVPALGTDSRDSLLFADHLAGVCVKTLQGKYGLSRSSVYSCIRRMQG